MGLIEVPVFEDLPLEVDKVYVTKMQTKDKFLLKEIRADKAGNIIMLYGYYIGKEDIGLCPMYPDRLIRDKKKTGTELVCEHCKR